MSINFNAYAIANSRTYYYYSYPYLNTYYRKKIYNNLDPNN